MLKKTEFPTPNSIEAFLKQFPAYKDASVIVGSFPPDSAKGHILEPDETITIEAGNQIVIRVDPNNGRPEIFLPPRTLSETGRKDRRNPLTKILRKFVPR